MQFTLKPEAEQFVSEQIKAGRFKTPDEVLNEAVSRMMIEDETELDDETVAAIREADEQFQRGEFIEFDKFAAQMRKRISGS